MSDQPVRYEGNAINPMPPTHQVVSIKGPITVYPDAPEELVVLAEVHNAEIAATEDRFRRLVRDAFDRYVRDSWGDWTARASTDPMPSEIFEREVRGLLRVDRQTCCDALMEMAGSRQAAGDLGTANGLILAAQQLMPRPG